MTDVVELPLEDAPFSKYLEILREEGREQDAEDAKEFYLGFLTEFGYDREKIMSTSFRNLVKAVELVLGDVQREMVQSQVETQLGGKVLVGKDVDEETLKRVAPIHARAHEEHKLRNMR